MLLKSRSGKTYFVLFTHIDTGDCFCRNIETGQERWIRKEDSFYTEEETKNVND